MHKSIRSGRVTWKALGFATIGVVLSAAVVAMSQQENRNRKGSVMSGEMKSDGGQLEKATFGGGCFWCTEAIFERLPGVKSVVSGYCGGNVENPTYRQVSSGRTGHAEVVQMTYDPQRPPTRSYWRSFSGTITPRRRIVRGPTWARSTVQ